MAEIATPPAGSVTNATAHIYAFLFPLPVACFAAALATDLAYVSTAYLMWLHFSEWLVAAGLAVGALAAVVLLVEFMASRAVRRGAFGWAHLALFYAALVVELFNSFVHSIDGWTAVMPGGMALSVLGAVLALAAAALMFRAPIISFAFREPRP